MSSNQSLRLSNSLSRYRSGEHYITSHEVVDGGYKTTVHLGKEKGNPRLKYVVSK
jgi:hypothetical protein